MHTNTHHPDTHTTQHFFSGKHIYIVVVIPGLVNEHCDGGKAVGTLE